MQCYRTGRFSNLLPGLYKKKYPILHLEKKNFELRKGSMK